MVSAAIDGIPVFDAVISDDDCGMFKISLVENPAIMSNFLAFDRTRKMLMYSIQDEEKRLVVGPVMRADFPIYRIDPARGEYYVIYRAEEIRKMAEKYLLENRQNDVNLMHAEGPDVSGVQMVQYFIKDSTKGVSPAGFEDIADGSLFAEFHIVNDEVWEAIKGGAFKGFSLEGVFELVAEKDIKRTETIADSLEGLFGRIFKTTNKMSKLSRFKAALAKILVEFGNVTTDKGILAWDGEEDLAAGNEVFIEGEDGERIAPEDGDYTTADGIIYRVAGGKVAEIVNPEVSAEPAPEAEPAGAQLAAIPTDKGELLWNGEEDLKAGDEVFIEKEGERIPAEDGEYITEDGKVIVITEGKVAEIKDAEAEVAPAPESEEMAALKAENEILKAENETLRKQVEEMSKQPAAAPAHEVVKNAADVKETGNKGLDRLQRYLSAK